MLAKFEKRLRRKERVRAKIFGTHLRPRLSVYRSNTTIYAQLIDDVSWITLCSASDLHYEKNAWKSERAMKVWEEIASKAKDLNIQEVVFDRGWFVYHGRVKFLADGARSAWLIF